MQFSRLMLFILATMMVFAIERAASSPGMVKTGEEYRELTPDGAWCWFQEPRAVYCAGEHSRTYTGWVDSSGNICLRHYDHRSGELGPIRVLKEHILHDGRPDDHDCPTILVLPDHRLQVFYAPHSEGPMWYRVSQMPEDDSAWGEEFDLGTNTEGKSGLTYPNPFRLPAEDRIFLFWRGGNFKPNYSISTNGQDWEPARTLIQGSGARPYVKYASNGRDEIHFAFTDGHPHVEPANSIYYMRYRDGIIWRTPAGDEIKTLEQLPLAPAEAAKIYDGATRGKAWIWDLALDNEGRPVMVFSVMPEDTLHYYHYARWDGEKWRENRITFAGTWFPQTQPGETEREPNYSGGVVLDQHDPSIVYLSRKVSGVFEIESWSTPDMGASWNSEAITSGSKNSNVRPLVSRVGPGEPEILFWMNGDYIHYTRFTTSIRMLPLVTE